MALAHPDVASTASAAASPLAATGAARLQLAPKRAAHHTTPWLGRTWKGKPTPYDQRGGGKGHIPSSIESRSPTIPSVGFCPHLQPGRLSEIDLESVALALVAAGHFSAGVAEMFLNVGLLDLGGGGEAGAQRVAAEREPPLALGQGRREGRRRARMS